MSAERDRTDENFLARWSRLKSTPEGETPEAAAVAQPAQAAAQSEPPPLPPVEDLTIESDFRGFLHPKVNEDVRRAALRKLFSDPHFNVMDGLDVYIDDYSKADPIPPEMLAGLRQAQRILQWAEGKEEENEKPEGLIQPPPEEPPALSAAAAVAPAETPATHAAPDAVPARRNEGDNPV